LQNDRLSRYATPATPTIKAADRLIKQANEYQILAEAMPPDDPPADHLPMPPPAPAATITQPMQQQQQKKEDEE